MRRATHTIRRQRPRARFLRLTLAGFVCRALIPLGFMPASLADGGPVVVCHGGAAGAFFEALAEARHAGGGHVHDAGGADHADHGSHAPDDAAGADHTGWERCPVGAAYAGAPLSHEFSLSLLSLAHVYAQAEPAAAPTVTTVSPYRARAPPPDPLSLKLS
jgi:hypothetical protein